MCLIIADIANCQHLHHDVHHSTEVVLLPVVRSTPSLYTSPFTSSALPPSTPPRHRRKQRRPLRRRSIAYNDRYDVLHEVCNSSPSSDDSLSTTTASTRHFDWARRRKRRKQPGGRGKPKDLTTPHFDWSTIRQRRQQPDYHVKLTDDSIADNIFANDASDTKRRRTNNDAPFLERYWRGHLWRTRKSKTAGQSRQEQVVLDSTTADSPSAAVQGGRLRFAGVNNNRQQPTEQSGEQPISVAANTTEPEQSLGITIGTTGNINFCTCTSDTDEEYDL